MPKSQLRVWFVSHSLELKKLRIHPRPSGSFLKGKKVAQRSYYWGYGEQVVWYVVLIHLPKISEIVAPLLQWNCKCILHHYSEFFFLISDFSPCILALQETHLKDIDILSPTDFPYSVRTSPLVNERVVVWLSLLNIAYSTNMLSWIQSYKPLSFTCSCQYELLCVHSIFHSNGFLRIEASQTINGITHIVNASRNVIQRY